MLGTSDLHWVDVGMMSSLRIERGRWARERGKRAARPGVERELSEPLELALNWLLNKNCQNKKGKGVERVASSLNF